MYYLLLTISPQLHTFYETFKKDDVYYLAYTDDEELAEIYAHQFTMKRFKIFYLPVPEYIIEGIRKNWAIPISQLIPVHSEIEDKVYAYSDEELQYMDEMMSDGAETEFDDLLYCIENLKRFKSKKIQKLRKNLEHLYHVLREPETEEEEDEQHDLEEDIDWGEHYHFLAERLDLFKENFNLFNEKSRLLNS